MLSTKQTSFAKRNRTKKSYGFTLNEEQMETLKRNNPNLNLSQFFDDLVKEENAKQERCNIFPFKELKEEGWRGVTFENKEEEKQFDNFFGLNEYYYDEDKE
ncbi:hypothetical protein NIES267_73590 (plasmid) [Calothrix parasitica NIES-267]|uniref:Uncharacterized protein n=1 Tax=Calothrix parasitica NIES-267 TaxID=1973488 RepID=A0A1Z4M309_9CYAN|nr:hypothetical protein NIES267_73590 [Calothrix parasitica NIES-267]